MGKTCIQVLLILQLNTWFISQLLRDHISHNFLACSIEATYETITYFFKSSKNVKDSYTLIGHQAVFQCHLVGLAEALACETFYSQRDCNL